MISQPKTVQATTMNIISLWDEYSKLPSNLMNPADAGWHKRMVDIYTEEAPKTLTKLILELRLADEAHLEFRDFNDNEVEFNSVIRSVNENLHSWENAFATYGDSERTKFLYEQFNFQANEMYRSLANIKGD